MTNTVKVESNLPRLTTYNGGVATRGERLDLAPGANEVDADLFADKIADGGDWLLRLHVAEGAVRAEDQPRVAPPSAEIVGTAAQRAPSDMKASVETVESPPRAESIAPTQVGGGVPGTVPEAQELVSKTEDPDRLHLWLKDEKRVMVRRTLRARIGELSSGDDGNSE